MPFPRPTVQELLERALGDMNARIPGADSRIRRSILHTLGVAHSGATHGLYGYLDWIADQIFPDTAEGEQLERHAAIYGIGRQAATFAELTATATGQEGAAIPLGAVLLRSDGPEYVTTALAVISGGATTLQLMASEPGAAANAEVGALLNFLSPVSGVNSVAAVAEITNAGADLESDEKLRQRVLRRLQQPPRGGSASDYVTWALEVDEVTRAWAIEGMNGLGTVGVTFVVDDHPTSIIPDGTKVQEVADYIDARRPITAAVNTFAPIANAIDFEIALNPNTAEVQTAVQLELADLLRREAAPEVTIPLSRVGEAISAAPGEISHDLVVPASNITVALVEIPVLGVITWS